MLLVLLLPLLVRCMSHRQMHRPAPPHRRPPAAGPSVRSAKRCGHGREDVCGGPWPCLPVLPRWAACRCCLLVLCRAAARRRLLCSAASHGPPPGQGRALRSGCRRRCRHGGTAAMPAGLLRVRLRVCTLSWPLLHHLPLLLHHLPLLLLLAAALAAAVSSKLGLHRKVGSSGRVSAHALRLGQ